MPNSNQAQPMFNATFTFSFKSGVFITKVSIETGQFLVMV
jgi:hypothetical protein